MNSAEEIMEEGHLALAMGEMAEAAILTMQMLGNAWEWLM